MSVDSILNYIIGEADKEKSNILQQAKQEADKIIQQAKQEAGLLYKEIIDEEKVLLEKERQKLIVNSTLEGRKKLLRIKQEMIDAVFEKLKSSLEKDRFKKKQIFQDKIKEVSENVDFYLDKIRLDYETEIEKVLFS